MITFKEIELKLLLILGKKYLWGGPDVHQYLQKGGIILEPASFYSTTPQINDLENAFEYSEDMPFAVERIFNIQTIRDNILSLLKYSKEFSPPLDGDESKPEEYFWKNGMFSYSDAMSYYAMIRKLKPKTIIEIGSGFSTLVALKAIKRNRVGKIICIEPYPTSWLRNLKGIILLEKPAQDFPAGFFNQELTDGDIVFIDSTHTVKPGSDCLHLYLRILPQLRPELFIHAHDIFLPYPLPLEWALNNHIYWTEQYLLLAYMIGNKRCTVLFGSYFVEKKLPDELKAFMHDYYPGGGGSLWFNQASSMNSYLKC